MRKITVRAPVRADLAGGTLDLWPLYLFHPGSRTVNVAISYYAESEIVEISNGIEIHLTDQQYEQHYDSLHELAADPKAALVHRVLEHFSLTGIRITTRTDAPRGSGLGGSSALSVTLVRALSELADKTVEGDDLIALVRDLETRLIGVPAGIQDYYPPVYGGLAALHLEPGAVVRHEIALPLEKLSEHMLLHYSGVAHFSGTNNWEMYKRQIEGKKKIHKGFDRITRSATEMEKALESGNMEAAGAALAHEWMNRKALIDGISTPEIEAAIDAAIKAGAWGGKVCGAGGGGCVVFLLPPDRRDAVRSALAEAPGRVLDAQPVAHGLTIERNEDAQSSSHAVRERRVERRGEPIEQLYVHGGRGPYKPFVMAQAVITLSEPRSGVHQSVVRSYAAPLDPQQGSVDWTAGQLIADDALQLHAVADPNKTVPRVPIDTLTQAATQSEESLRQLIAEREKLQLFHNAAFGIYSAPHESREAFAARCAEEAKRRLGEEAERLESTFRRRIDQVKERAEKDQRDLDNKEQRPAAEERLDDVNVAWGQALYKITSGKPAAVADAPQSVREVDYLDKIAQIQRAWDKELQGRRDELDAQAKEIAEIVVTPSGKNIEIAKFVVVWAARL